MFVSNNYKELFKKVYNEELQPNQLAKLIEKELIPVCSELKIGKILISVNLPPFYNEKQTELSEVSIFSDKFNSTAEPVVTKNTTFSKGTVIFKSYPTEGYFWDDSAKSDIEFLHNQLFIIFSRSHMNKLIIKSKETDSLTGSLNRDGIIHLGNIIFNRHLISKFSLVFMNIKKFRKINDIVTSKNGDIILKQYTIIINEFLQKDGALGRLGGDNFLIIVKNSRLGALLKMLEKVRITVDVEGVKKTAIISVKAGIGQGNNHLPCFDALIGCASTAFKAAKASATEDYLFYRPDMGMPPKPAKNDKPKLTYM